MIFLEVSVSRDSPKLASVPLGFALAHIEAIRDGGIRGRLRGIHWREGSEVYRVEDFPEP